MGEIDCIEPEYVSDAMAPTCRQIYKLTAVALDAFGRDWPGNRREATEVINELQLAAALRRIPSA